MLMLLVSFVLVSIITGTNWKLRPSLKVKIRNCVGPGVADVATGKPNLSPNKTFSSSAQELGTLNRNLLLDPVVNITDHSGIDS